jgi:hypothetical protein
MPPQKIPLANVAASGYLSGKTQNKQRIAALEAEQ